MNIFLLYLYMHYHQQFFAEVTSGVEGTVITEEEPVVTITPKVYQPPQRPQEPHTRTKEVETYIDPIAVDCYAPGDVIIDIHCNEKD